MKQDKNKLTRREALKRLGRYSVTAYVVPNVVLLSEARASGASGSGSQSDPTPPSPPTAPSNIEEIEADELLSDKCRGDDAGGDSPEQTGMETARQAVEAGYARPLDSVLRRLSSQYDGRVVGVSFTGFRWRPRYRFRAVSVSGRLETVIVSARTGKIVRIEGCR